MSQSGSARSGFSALVLVVLLGCAPICEARAQYWRVTGDHVTVICSPLASRCAHLSTQFLAFNRLLRYVAGWDDDYVPAPLTVYSLPPEDAASLLLTAEDRKQQRGSNNVLSSKFLPGREEDFAAIVESPGAGDSPAQGVMLLYTESIILGGPTARFPPWYQLGVANLVNGVMIRADGTAYLDRNQPFEPLVDKAHQTRGRYDLKQLLQVTAADLNAGGDFKEFIRRSRSWAQFGLLTTPERRAQYRELCVLMRQGANAEEAIQSAFGKPFAQVQAEFEDGHWRKSAQFRLSLPGAPQAAPATERLDSAEADKQLRQLAERVQAEPVGR